MAMNGENQTDTHNLQRQHSHDMEQDQVASKFDLRIRKFVKTFVRILETKLSEYCKQAQGESEKVSKRFEVLGVVLGVAAKSLCAVSDVPSGTGVAAKVGAGALANALGANHHQKRANQIYANMPQAEKLTLRRAMVEAAVEIFQSFEMQLMEFEVGEDQAWDVVMFYLAQEATERILDHTYKVKHTYSELSSQLFTEAFLGGKSKFKLSKLYGGIEVKFRGNSCKIPDLYDRVGVLKRGNPSRYYNKKDKNGVSKASKYGYRLNFHWEILSGLEEDTPPVAIYNYVLDSEEAVMQKVEKLLDVINNGDPIEKQNQIAKGVNNIQTQLNKIELQLDAVSQEHIIEIQNLGNSVKDYMMQTTDSLSQPKGVNSVKPIWFDVSDCPDSFTGRDMFVNSIHSAFLSGSRLVSVLGADGIGKRELARKFAYRHRYDDLYGGNIVWINSGSPCELMRSFVKLVKYLKSNFDFEFTEFNLDNNVPVAVQFVQKYFESKNCLFIFENVHDSEDIVNHLPLMSGDDKSRILITSRNDIKIRTIPSKLVTPLKLGQLTVNEAEAFVRKELEIPKHCPGDEVLNLVETLHCLPAALRLAAACIKAKYKESTPSSLCSVYALEKYIKEFSEIHMAMGCNEVQCDDHCTVLNTVISLSLKLMRREGFGEEAFKVLEIFSYLSPDYVQWKVYSRLVNDRHGLQEILNLLAQYSFISTSDFTSGYRMCSLVQERVRESHLNDQRKEILRKALGVLSSDLVEELVVYVWKFAVEYQDLVCEFCHNCYGGESNSVLHVLVKNNCVNTTKKFLDNISDVDVKNKCLKSLNKSSNTPLHLAAKNGFLNIVQFLTDKNAHSCDENKWGRTPLEESIVKSQLHVAHYLFEKLDFVNASPEKKLNLACSAAVCGSMQFLKYLEEKENVNFFRLGKADSLPLHHACKRNKLCIIRYLMSLESNVNAKDKDGNSPLHLAAQAGHLEIVKYLVGEKGAKVSQLNKSYKTPVHDAIRYGRLEVVKYLLQHEKPHTKYTLQHEASYSRRLSILKCLVEDFKLKINVTDMYGNTPLHEAASSGDLEVVRYLVAQQSAAVEARNNHGKTPLHKAAASGKMRVVKYFVEDQKVPIDIRDKYGSTALHEAAFGGCLEVVTYLADCGNVNDVNEYNRSPLFGAVKKNHMKVIEYLVDEKKCDVTIKDKNDETVLDVAHRWNHESAVKYLQDRIERAGSV